MGKKVAYIVGVLIIAAIALVVWRKVYSNPKQAPQGAMGGAPPVPVQMPKVQDVEESYEFTGNTAATEEVEIRARVEGFLATMDFVDGEYVDKGDLLFTIEPNEYIAKRDQAQAQLLSSQAELARAEQDYQRALTAIKTNAISQQDLSTKKADLDKAKAQVMAATAQLNDANLNLSYTRIQSPISGRVSRRLVDPGNLVGAGGQTLLATVVRMQPMYVYFNVSENILQQYFIRHGITEDKVEKARFQIGFAGGEDYPYEGFLDYIDTKVDAGTGTIVIRGQVPNTEKTLFPGMFVKVRVPAGIKRDAILIEERAVNSDIGGKYVLTVDPNDVVHHQYVKLGRKVGVMRVIDSGISSDQRYIVSGFLFARPGAKVTPVPEGGKDQPASLAGSGSADKR
ncbi:MAG TPA: efflux RND transporter periplasmic adaptor subunit [Sedimentisphaerales bacterium]|nr:efflux RND transporter periplasmic adaptor subunit [Sedimentisphaerales bacterium]